MKKILFIGVILLCYCSTAHAGAITWITAMSANSNAEQAKNKAEEANQRLDKLEKQMDRIEKLLQEKQPTPREG